MQRDISIECLIYALEDKPAYRQIQVLIILWLLVMAQTLKRAWIVAGVVIAALVITAALINVTEISLILGVSAGIIFGGLLVITVLSDTLKR